MARGVQGIALHDVTMVENAVLEIGDFRGRPDRGQLYQDLKKFLAEYGSASMGTLDIAEALQALMEIMKANKIRLPHGVTMLCRGLTHVEGVLAKISPDINMMQIAATRYTDDLLQHVDWKKEWDKNARMLYRSARKGAEIPALMTDALKEYLEGQSTVNIDLHSSEDLSFVVFSSVRNIVIGVCIAALLVSSSIICVTDMTPKVFGIPLLGFAGYAFALVCSTLLTVRYIYHKLKKK